MIHYFGTPITPASTYEGMCPNNFCVSFFESRDAAWCLKNAQSIMWDNGAYSSFTLGVNVDWQNFYRWLEGKLYQPHWAVVPDIIGGTVEDNLKLEKEWPHPKELSAVVYHFGEPLGRISQILDSGWGKLAIGGAVGSFNPGSEAWVREIDRIWNTIEQGGGKPWVHMMRAHSKASMGRWPFASADSASWARNHAEYGAEKWHKLHNIVRTNPTIEPNLHMELF